jgi:hypothetical protein
VALVSHFDRAGKCTANLSRVSRSTGRPLQRSCRIGSHALRSQCKLQIISTLPNLPRFRNIKGMPEMTHANDKGKKVSKGDRQWNPDSMYAALSEDQLRVSLVHSILRYGLLSRMVTIPGGAGIVSRLVLDQVRLDLGLILSALQFFAGNLAGLWSILLVMMVGRLEI